MFVGKVRDMNLGDTVIICLWSTISGYDRKITERDSDQAEARRGLFRRCVIHQVGDLDIGDQIVLRWCIQCTPWCCI
ncbi:molybdenum cofactor biosynthesis protein MoaE [Vibrio chagasii]|nr:molybdenum cofactor biosynthesis protein MoaE [Vibrio chagasii]